MEKLPEEDDQRLKKMRDSAERKCSDRFLRVIGNFGMTYLAKHL